MTDITFYLFLIALGIVSGFLAGLLGIGGGVILVPFLITLFEKQLHLPTDITIKMAIATSMAVIIFTSISSVVAHNKRGAILWHWVRQLTMGIAIGAAIASFGIFNRVNGTWLGIFFACFLSFAAIQMFLGKNTGSNKQMPNLAGNIVAGSVIGGLSGLVGVGGGFISIPFMTWRGLPLHNAVATSAALGFFIALFNAFGFALGSIERSLGIDSPPHTLGFIYLPALVAIAGGSILMAPIGAKVSHALPVLLLRKIFAILLLVLSFSMLYKIAQRV